MFRFLLVITLVTVVTMCIDEEAWYNAEEGDDIGLADLLEEEDIQAILKKYDIDDNGELSEDELELGRGEISSAVRRKQKELRKDPDRADDETEKPDVAASEQTEKNTTNYILLSVIGGGVVLVLAAGVMKRQQTPAPTPMSPDAERLLLKRREEWLDKMSSQNVAHNQQRRLNNSKQSTPLSTARNNTKSKAQISRPDLVPTDDTQTLQNTTDKPEFKTDQQAEKSEDKSDQLKPVEQTDECESMSTQCESMSTQCESMFTQCESMSTQSQMKVGISLTGTDPAEMSDQPQHNQKQIVRGKPDISQGGSADSTEDLVSSTHRQTAQAQRAPATSNKNNLRQFLSSVLDSTIDITTTGKIRYSLGSLTINAKDVPEQPAGIPAFLVEVMKKIVPRQISHIKYIMKCYSICEEFQPHYNDHLVTAAGDWLKQYSVGVIMDSLKTESANAEDDDLWSDYDNTHVASEAVNFLLCVTGWSKDCVQVPASLLSRLLQQSEDSAGAAKEDNSVLFLTVLLQAAGQQVASVERMDEVILREGKTLRALEILLDNGTAGAVLAIALEKEVPEAAKGLGNYFEKSSLFGPLLAVSTVPTKFQRSVRSP
ncbi:uncharacterized protein LOC124253228 isoform X2 [Haliotis rubra]|uniref:uncharacterized protein LOC124253228 isoform X2 n=1 Tax=Haliotis rubra TaxID=36100 RepID=UPI001EE535A5|nr:uncharacterized protein LOC124253228 isoform X2 [Haliotis rubra]